MLLREELEMVWEKWRASLQHQHGGRWKLRVVEMQAWYRALVASCELAMSIHLLRVK